MKALILTREFPPHVYGGAGVHVDALVRELRRLVEVEVRCFGDQLASGDGVSVRGYGAPEALLARAPAGLRGALDAAARGVAVAADPVDADVVHCHTWYSLPAGILCTLLYGLPLVVTVHSLEPLRPWKREQLGRGYDYSSWVERAGLEMADAVIAVVPRHGGGRPAPVRRARPSAWRWCPTASTWRRTAPVAARRRSRPTASRPTSRTCCSWAA